MDDVTCKCTILYHLFKKVNSLRADGDWTVTKGRTQKLPKKLKIVETHWHDHSLESSWGACSDGTISFSIPHFQGEKAFSELFSNTCNLSP
jgi:hypothetical protein